MEERRRILAAPEGYRSRDAGLFVAQMDDQNRRLTEDTRGATAAELEWQPSRGSNTAGMLMAHIAIVEVHWIHVALHGSMESEIQPVLGIGMNDDGMPIRTDGLPPATLHGKDLAYFDDLLVRARNNTRHVVKAFTDADLEREIPRHTAWDGNVYLFNVRWILYHILEHEAGHYGQINMLRHLYRTSTPMAALRR